MDWEVRKNRHPTVGDFYSLVYLYSCGQEFIIKAQKIIKKKIMSLQKFRYTSFFKTGINLIFLSVYNSKSSKLLIKFIEMQLKTIKRQKKIETAKTEYQFGRQNYSAIFVIKYKPE